MENKYVLRLMNGKSTCGSMIIKLLLFIGALFVYVIIFNMISPEVVASLVKGKVTSKDVAANPDKNYIGYQAADDIPRLKDKEEVKNTGEFITIEADKAIPLEIYKIKNKKDMEALKYSRNSKGRKVYNPSKKIYEYMTYPGSLASYYNPFYLIELSDGTYVATYLDEFYGNKLIKGEDLTLPVGRLGQMLSPVKDKMKILKSEYSISDQAILYCYNDESYSRNQTFYMMIQAGIALMVILVLYGILGRIFPNIWKILK